MAFDDNELNGLVNYMGGGRYLSMMGGNGGNMSMAGYKGVQNPFDKESRMGRIASMAAGRIFTLTVINETETVQDFYLIPSYLVTESENGHPLSGKSVAGATLEFSSPNGATNALAMKAFYRYIDQNPSLILGLRIESSDKTEMTKTISVTTEVNPYLVTFPSKTLNIQSFVDENNMQRDIATIDQLLPADRECQIKIPVIPGNHTFTLFMGPTFNTTQALRQQAMQAASE